MKILLSFKQGKKTEYVLTLVHLALDAIRRKPVYLPLEPAALKYDCALFSLCERKYLNHCSIPPTQPYSHSLARTQLYSCHFTENQGPTLVLRNQSLAVTRASEIPSDGSHHLPEILPVGLDEPPYRGR